MRFYGNVNTIKEMQFALYRSLTSYILSGDKGLGKATIGKHFARSLLCESKDFKSVQCFCKSCGRLLSGNHPDFIEIKAEEGAKSIKVDQVREVLQEVYRAPILSNRKVIFIDDADLLTEEGQNALLKTLEEGFTFATFVFIAHRELLPTIKSRSITFEFKPISKETLSRALEIQSSLEKDLILAGASGVGRAMELEKDQGYFEQSKNLINALSNISNVSKDKILDSLGLLKEKDESSIFESEYFEELLNIMHTFFLDMLRTKVGDNRVILKHIEREVFARYQKLSLKAIDQLVSLVNGAIEDRKRSLLTRDELFFLFLNINNIVEEDVVC